MIEKAKDFNIAQNLFIRIEVKKQEKFSSEFIDISGIRNDKIQKNFFFKITELDSISIEDTNIKITTKNNTFIINAHQRLFDVLDYLKEIIINQIIQ